MPFIYRLSNSQIILHRFEIGFTFFYFNSAAMSDRRLA
jgi:hypothetical protein